MRAVPYMPNTPSRHPMGSPYGGQFAPVPRTEATFTLDYDTDPREEFRVVDGECLNCGHYDDHEFCEFCSPSCSGCGTEIESGDLDMCEHCREREEEYDDESWA